MRLVWSFDWLDVYFSFFVWVEAQFWFEVARSDLYVAVIALFGSNYRFLDRCFSLWSLNLCYFCKILNFGCVIARSDWFSCFVCSIRRHVDWKLKKKCKYWCHLVGFLVGDRELEDFPTVWLFRKCWNKYILVSY